MRVIRSVPKLLVVAVVAYAMARMWHWKLGFTYFTQLSNLFCAGAMLLQLWAENRPGQAPRVARDVKFAATTSIVATGVVYLTVLAPLEPQGMLAAYAQDGWASLCLHGIVPALMVADFVANDAREPFAARNVRLALVPPALYLMFVLALGAAGVRWGGGTMMGPYPFLNYASPVGWFGLDQQAASATTPGLGVAWSCALMLLFLMAIGWALVGVSRRRGKDA